MEQAKLFIAIGISVVIFFAWSLFFPQGNQRISPEIEKTDQVEKIPGNEPENGLNEKINDNYGKKKINDNTNFKREAENATRKPGRAILARTPLYEARISEKGAALKSFVLKNYMEEASLDSPYKELLSENLASGSLTIDFLNKSVKGLDKAVFKSSIEAEELKISDSKKELLFTWESPEGLVIEKKYIFNPSEYGIDMEIKIKNRTDAPIDDIMAFSLVAPAPDKSMGYGFEGPSAMVDRKVEQIKVKKNDEIKKFSGKIKFVAIETRYFLQSILNKNVSEGEARAFKKNGDRVYCQLAHRIAIDPGYEKRFDFAVYYGPKSLDIIRGVDDDLARVINFGWFDFIAKPCLWLMNFFYRYIPNYGVAIIILTLLIKILLWPLGAKSYKSMSEMKKLQPIMAEIREKYKHDKKKMNAEIMSLYKTYKINPVGGCLPMVAQIPVFFAFYRMLYQAIELRHAPFFLWINDLSAPDRLFHFPFDVPYMESPDGIPVLTIIMGATMFLQQKMSPPMGDPKQAKMMMTLMPVIFTIMFINFSSGLVLYWLINNVLSIGQQYYITKKYSR